MATTRRTHDTRIRALEAQLQTLVDLLTAQAQAPAKAAPAQAKAESQFVVDMRARAAAKKPCAIHPAGTCNRRFSAKSSGATSHVARLV